MYCLFYMLFTLKGGHGKWSERTQKSGLDVNCPRRKHSSLSVQNLIDINKRFIIMSYQNKGVNFNYYYLASFTIMRGHDNAKMYGQGPVL